MKIRTGLILLLDVALTASRVLHGQDGPSRHAAIRRRLPSDVDTPSTRPCSSCRSSGSFRMRRAPASTSRQHRPRSRCPRDPVHQLRRFRRRPSALGSNDLGVRPSPSTRSTTRALRWRRCRSRRSPKPRSMRSAIGQPQGYLKEALSLRLAEAAMARRRREARG